MKRLCSLIVVGIMGSLMALPTADAIKVVEKEDKALDIGIHAQLLGFAERIGDPVRNDIRLYLFLKQARLNLRGRLDDFKMHMQLVFGGEEEVRNKNASLGLLDLSVDAPLFKGLRVKFGQFNIPYSRERITDDAFFQFTDRSLQNLAFRMGRDVGIALHGYTDMGLDGTMGIFTGGGRDVPLRFLPEVLGIPLLVARVGINHDLDEDIYTLRQTDFNPDHLKWAFFVNGLYMHDSLVGHSTVLNVKATEKSLLTDSDWNPYINRSPLDKGNFWQAGGDVALRAPLSSYALTGEAEVNVGRYSNIYGSVILYGGRGQVGIYKKPIEVALRYAVIKPDDDFSNGGVAITGNQLIHEVGPAVTLYFLEHRLKAILETSLLVNVPVVTEANVGDYILTDQIGQATLVGTGNAVVRKTVPQAKLLLQASF